MLVLLRHLARLRKDAALPRPRGGSLALRHVDAGSCNGCEHELQAAASPFHDLQRFGLSITASPRHADVLLVTGPVTARMLDPLRMAYEAMPEPRLVAALGDCALGCGLLGDPSDMVGALERVLPVDLRIPGCPPSPGRSPGTSWRPSAPLAPAAGPEVRPYPGPDWAGRAWGSNGVVPPRLPRHGAAGLLVALLALLPATAAAAPTISGADGQVWNADQVPPTYTITGSEDGASIRWLLQGPTSRTGTGPSPLPLVLSSLRDGAYRLTAAQTSPPDSGRASRTFTVDTTPPAITVDRPEAGAVYERGEVVVADFSCAGAATCRGTVADGEPIATSASGTHVFTVTARDAAGNEAEERIEYQVAAAPPPSAPPSGTPQGTPTPPSPPIRLAPAPSAEPGDEDPEPVVRNAKRLRPPAGATLTVRRPVLRWTRVGVARLYNLQIYRMRDGRATKIVSEFPTGNRFRVPRGRLAWDERYVWRVWPLIGNSYPSEPLGLSWFELRRPVRLTSAQLLVNQRISQAALRRTDAISEWLDAGLVAGDLRDGGLAAADFGDGVRLSGSGTPIDNGFAAPRPLVTDPPSRAGTRPRLRVSARQLLVNQRISQAAVRRANALARRIEGGLTGGDLREGVVTANKLAPGLRVDSAEPAGPRPAPSTTAIAAAKRAKNPRVRMTDRQVLINQRISQAAVRRANAMMALIERGLVGTHFQDGAIGAASISPALRS